MWIRTAATVLSLFAAAVTAADNTTEPLSTYYSRPEIQAPALTVSIHEDSATSGYIFISPYGGTQPGPYIYDKSGNLIWSGFAISGPGNAHNFHVCQYQGEDHLCMFQGANGPPGSGYARGHGIILNNRYTVVASVELGNHAISSDEHEFNVINDGHSALLTSYPIVPYDLSGYNVTTGQGWLIQGQFQEVDVSTGNVIFDWYSLDHVDPSESYVLPNGSDTSGTGLTPQTAWDYFHINSVDKSNVTGDYLISARHVSSIFYLNSSDGGIIWRLSADGRSTFECTNFNFSYQHDARLVSENDTHTVIGFYDNASNGFNQTSTESSGKVVVIDHDARTATLIREITAPVPGGIQSTSQGDMQLLDNGGVFQGYGNVDAFSEHNATGDAVLYATFGAYPVMNYRAFTFTWTGRPATSPSLHVYARNSSAPTTVWASWNGATEVKTWQFYGASQAGAEWETLGERPWEGFETVFTADGFYAMVVAEAVDAEGNSLGRSQEWRTFVPGVMLAEVCDDLGCPVATAYSS